MLYFAGIPLFILRMVSKGSINKLIAKVKPGGYFFVGLSETVTHFRLQ
jgi:chemotaxis methyl-accepting protein methylase